MCGTNFAAVLKARRGYSDEAIVIVTQWNSGRSAAAASLHSPPASDPASASEAESRSASVSGGEAMALAMALSLLRSLSRASWLAKDIIWLIADARFGADVAVGQWLAGYKGVVDSPCAAGECMCQPCHRSAHPSTRCASPPAANQSHERNHATHCSPAPTASTVWAQCTACTGAAASSPFPPRMLLLSAVSLEAASDWSGGAVDSLLLLSGGVNGQMPNLDLPAAMLKLAAWLGLDVRTHEHVDVHTHTHTHAGASQGSSGMSAVIDAVCALVDGAHAALSSVAGSGAAKFLHGQQFRSALWGLLATVTAQLGGEPGGVHGVMREVKVDAVTVRVRGRGGNGGGATHSHVHGARRGGEGKYVPLRYSVTRMGR